MSNKMWGGRFASAPDAIMEEINASIGFDYRLAPQDIAGSLAHVAMLAQTGIVSSEDAAAITEALGEIRGEIEKGGFTFSRALEDIHMNIESRLASLIGPAAGRLHTARSRNDQVAVDFRLWIRDTVDELDGQLHALQSALADRALAHAASVMPGFTHMQSAQPVTFGHHLLAYVEMLARDRSRLRDARVRMNECPLGAAALAGTSFPIDRAATAKALGFDRPTANSLDSVSDRDFVLETLSAAAICAMHLSRFAEEIVLWATPQFGFAALSDKFSTGSSIMPQKRNPDAAELVRGKAGRIIGALTALLIVMKGLPLTYSKDMQEDKEGTFDALHALSLCLAAMTGMVRDLEPDVKRMKAAAGAGYATATDLADWLVRTLHMPFRDAHHVTGRLVALASTRKVGLEKLTLAEMQSVEPRIEPSVYGVLGVEKSVRSRTSYGGTAPANVRAQAKRWVAPPFTGDESLKAGAPGGDWRHDMNAAYLSAMAALSGSAIGALSSFATTWLTQNSQTRSQRYAQTMARRERLYGEFIDEASRLFADALTHALEEPSKLVPLYAIVGKLRLFAPEAVVATADAAMLEIVQTYYLPNRDFRDPKHAERPEVDVLRAFSDACRDDLMG